MISQKREGVVEWHIVFAETSLKHWVFKFLKPKFRHVYAIRKSIGGQFWCVVNPRSTYLDVDMHPVNLYPSIYDLTGNDVNIVSVHIDCAVTKDIHQLGVLTCVDIVKSILGINDVWCFTPYKLYKKIGNHYG